MWVKRMTLVALSRAGYSGFAHVGSFGAIKTFASPLKSGGSFLTERVHQAALSSMRNDHPMSRLGYGWASSAAEEQFAKHPYKLEILDAIRHKMECYKESRGITLGPMRILWGQWEKYVAIDESLEAFFSREDLFKGVSVIRCGGDFKEHWVLRKELMQAAKKYVNDPSINRPTKERIDLLNSIREIVYKQKFISDPVKYLKTADITAEVRVFFEEIFEEVK